MIQNYSNVIEHASSLIIFIAEFYISVIIVIAY
jgi:hypothetical protein